jgi:lysophospholipase L1-like esterase
MHPWHHYVALGDSFTEGIGDPAEGFARLGVVDHLAAALRQSSPDLRFTNLAQHGLGVGEIREQQLEPALRLEPDIASVVAGANDIMTGRFDVTRWEAAFRTLYQALTQAGAVVISANIPEFAILRTLKEPLQARLRVNIARGNAVIERLAAQYGVILVDAWAISMRSDREDWSADGVHLNSRGYFKFAQETLKTLERQTGFRIGDIEVP